MLKVNKLIVLSMLAGRWRYNVELEWEPGESACVEDLKIELSKKSIGVASLVDRPVLQAGKFHANVLITSDQPKPVIARALDSYLNTLALEARSDNSLTANKLIYQALVKEPMSSSTIRRIHNNLVSTILSFNAALDDATNWDPKIREDYDEYVKMRDLALAKLALLDRMADEHGIQIEKIENKEQHSVQETRQTGQ